MLAMLLAASGSIVSCSSTETRDFQNALPYPAKLTHAGVMNVQFVRDGTTLMATNTSGETFTGARMWINRRFSRPIGEWKSGDRLSLDLRDFRDEYGDAFRAGGFFATRRPDPVVMVEIENGTEPDRKMVGFVIVKGDAE